MGCGVGKFGSDKRGYPSLNTSIWQTGFNGDSTLGFYSFLDNGGFNPIMNPENVNAKRQEHFNPTTKINDPEQKNKLWLHAQKFSEREENYIKENILKDLKDKDGNTITHSKFQKQLLGVGFTRLLHYNWAALIKEAGELIKNNKCKNVELNFICHDNAEGDLDEQEYWRRLNNASFDNLSDKDRVNLTDAKGRMIAYDRRQCVRYSDDSSDRRDIHSVPTYCGAKHVIDKDIFREYQQSSCGDFLSKVSTKYHDNRRLQDKPDLFRDVSNNHTHRTLLKTGKSEVDDLGNYVCPGETK